MIDEITESNIRGLIDKIPNNANTLERVILCNEGTVQTLLSIIFDLPVGVNVITQKETGDRISRSAELTAEYAPDNMVIVCSAETSMNKSECPEGFINGIREKKFGIGQLISSIGLHTKRKLLLASSNEHVFSRVYTIESVGEDDPRLKIIITETFEKLVYRKRFNQLEW